MRVNRVTAGCAKAKKLAHNLIILISLTVLITPSPFGTSVYASEMVVDSFAAESNLANTPVLPGMNDGVGEMSTVIEEATISDDLNFLSEDSTHSKLWHLTK